jgi:ribosomal protein S18 acetylase RimI-like enzyme
MRRMEAAGETAVQLVVNINNPGAEKAYRQLGFETAGCRARYERIG